jgi:hypothetical protein
VKSLRKAGGWNGDSSTGDLALEVTKARVGSDVVNTGDRVTISVVGLDDGSFGERSSGGVAKVVRLA